MGQYRGRWFIRRRIWRCGGYAEAEYYPVFQKPGVRRSKCRPTRECQQKLNQRDAEKRLRRLILMNFCETDLEMDLTYAEPESAEGAARDLGKYLRGIRQSYRKAGEELRYIYTIEQGKQSGRIHFHLLLNAGPVSRDALEAMWKHGFANSRRLRLDETGLAGLSAYISKGGLNRRPEELGKRRWSCSRNLQRPQSEITDGAVREMEIRMLEDEIERRNAEEETERLFPGMTLVEAEALRNRVNGGRYVYLSLAPPEAWHGRRPMARYFAGELGGDDECSD